jgi:ketosteroid isomerase-like protein
MAQGNLIEKVQALYAAFGRGEIQTVLEALDPQIVWENPGPAEVRYFGTHRGPEAVLRNIFGFLQEFVDIKRLEPTRFLADDDKVVVLLQMELVTRPAGKQVAQEVAHVWTFKNGRVAHFHDFQNNAAVAAALRG